METAETSTTIRARLVRGSALVVVGWYLVVVGFAATPIGWALTKGARVASNALDLLRGSRQRATEKTQGRAE